MKKIIFNISCLLLTTMAGFAQEDVYPAGPSKGLIFITNATIHVGNGQVINNGTIKINNGKIEQVGAGIAVPSGDAKVYDAKGKQVYPGLILPYTDLGLKEIANGCITRHHSHHYFGFAETQWKLFDKERPRRVKPLLYVYRVLLTGIHLMQTGQLEANLITLNHEFQLPYLDELIARKLAGPEHGALDDADVEFHAAEYARLKNQLEAAFQSSRLPDAPTAKPALHELLIRDPRHTSPNSLQCFEPCHFLVTEGVFEKYGRVLLPDKRPMDNMAAGWDRPQEDEFALALLGQPSTYTDFAFPNSPPMWPGALDLSGLTPGQLAAWKRTLVRFLKAVTYRDPRRLVLKSPPHTARLPVLLELFPDAKFVHIKRNPYTLFASTTNLWMSFGKKHLTI